MEEKNKKSKKKLKVIIVILIILILISLVIILEKKEEWESTLLTEPDLIGPQEIEEFNSIWTIYEGRNKYIQTKKLINELIKNAEDLRNLIQVKPIILFKQNNIKKNINYELNNLNAYIEELNEINILIEENQIYEVSFGYDDKGFIRVIGISPKGDNLEKDVLLISNKIVEESKNEERINEIEDIMDEYIPPIFMWLIFTSPLWIILIVCIHSYRKKDKK